jgi:hypothetical protein
LGPTDRFLQIDPRSLFSWFPVWNSRTAGKRLITGGRLPVPGDHELGTIKKLRAVEKRSGKIGAIEHRFKEVRAVQMRTRQIRPAQIRAPEIGTLKIGLRHPEDRP